MSLLTHVPEVKEDDNIHVWVTDTGNAPNRLFHVKVLYVQLAPPTRAGRVQIILTCDVLEEVPDWVVEDIKRRETEALEIVKERKWWVFWRD